MPKVTPPKNVVPIGLITIAGKDYEVRQHPEFVRFFYDLFSRVGGVDALSNVDLEVQIQEGMASVGNARGPAADLDSLAHRVTTLENQVNQMAMQRDLLAKLNELRAEVEAQRWR